MSYNIVGSDGSLIPVAGNGGGGAVNSVNGQTGAVELKGSDIPVSETDSSTIETALNNKQNKLSATGNSNTPVFINSNKVPQACNAYAGGTSLTLNGSSKSGNTASIYAPTTAGTKGYVLTSNGTGAPTWQQNSGGGAVDSVNGQDGDVELTFNNIAAYSELGNPGQVLAVDGKGGGITWIDAGGGSGGGEMLIIDIDPYDPPEEVTLPDSVLYGAPVTIRFTQDFFPVELDSEQVDIPTNAGHIFLYGYVQAWRPIQFIKSIPGDAKSSFLPFNEEAISYYVVSNKGSIKCIQALDRYIFKFSIREIEIVEYDILPIYNIAYDWLYPLLSDSLYEYLAYNSLNICSISISAKGSHRGNTMSPINPFNIYRKDPHHEETGFFIENTCDNIFKFDLSFELWGRR